MLLNASADGRHLPKAPRICRGAVGRARGRVRTKAHQATHKSNSQIPYFSLAREPDAYCKSIEQCSWFAPIYCIDVLLHRSSQSGSDDDVRGDDESSPDAS